MTTGAVVRSVYPSQEEILLGIMRLGGIDRFDADLTYGNGSFYRGAVPQPVHRFDIDDTLEGVTVASSTALPLADRSIGSAVFDPPFLTYVRAGRSGNGGMIMSRRFAGYWTYGELATHYRDTLTEAARVLRRGGLLVVKCQDIIHNHKMHATHLNVVRWAEPLFRLKDLYVLPAAHRLPSPNRNGTQRHARIFHSYFLVLERTK